MLEINKDQSIEQTVNLVMSEMSKIGLEKGGLNKEQGYRYRSIDDAYAVLSKVLPTNGLIISSNCIEHTCENVEFGKYNTKARHVIQKIKYTIRHIHNKEIIEFDQIGQAIDTSDKAYNKAFTSAYKYMAINLFCIPDADLNTYEQVNKNTSTGLTQFDKVLDRINNCMNIEDCNYIIQDKIIGEDKALRYAFQTKWEELGLKWDNSISSFVINNKKE